MSDALFASLNGFAAGWSAAIGRAAWQGGLALLLAWLAGWLLPGLSANARCWLWRLAILKLLVAFCWSTPVDLPILPGERVTMAVAAAPRPPSAPLTLSECGVWMETPPAPASLSPAAWLLLAWALGVTTYGVRLALRWRSRRRLLADCRATDNGPLLAACAALCEQLRMPWMPRVVVTDRLPSPMLVGWLRPTLFLPSFLIPREWSVARGPWPAEEEAPPDPPPSTLHPPHSRRAQLAADLQLALAHELAHVRRHDLQWGWPAVLAEAFFFFHPLVWLARGETRLAQEAACDALALEVTRCTPARYGAMLVRMAARTCRGDRLSVGTLHVAEAYRSVRRRLLALQQWRPTVPRRQWGAALAVLALAVLVPWRAVAGQEVALVDLDAYANQPLKDGLFTGDGGNDMASLPQGDRLLDGVRFRIGPGRLQLGSTVLKHRPRSIQGIAIGRRFQRLHLLHGTAWGGGGAQSKTFVPDGTLIGFYTLRYEDGERVAIPVIYGGDVRDWWDFGPAATTTGRLAWSGPNRLTRSQGVRGIRLFHTAWKNPRPGVPITHLGFYSMPTPAAPFCVAVTCAD